MMMNLMTVLAKRGFTSSKPVIVRLSCPPPCGPFSIQENAVGGLSYKAKNTSLISQRGISILSVFISVSADYSIIVATRPEPTVLPPSRIANVRPCSIAIGWMSSMVISTLSPGMHISVPAGSSQTPVTSVVLK